MSYNQKRRGPGRPPKADEVKMIENMDATAAPVKIWQLLYDRCKEGDTQAIKTWLSYRYGQPRQMIDATIESVQKYPRPIFQVVNPPNLKMDKEG